MNKLAVIFTVLILCSFQRNIFAQELKKESAQASEASVLIPQDLPVKENIPMPAWVQNDSKGQTIDENIIREGDLLEVHVYPQEELSSAKTVDKEGKIFFEYVGRVQAAGLTLEQLQKNLTDSLKQYLENPRILIEKQTSSLERWLGWWKEAIVKPINIIGEVTYQGTYFTPRDDVTLIEAISTREGFRKEADLHHIKVIRKIYDKETSFIVDVKDIMEAKKPDFILKRGDVVIVPRRERATVAVMGEVRLPKPVELYEDQGMTLMEAVQINEGFTKEADVNAIRVNRTVDGKIETFIVRGGEILKGNEPDVPLKNGDIVFIPQGGKLIHIFGQVNHPGPINVSLYGERITLAEAISLAGDFTRIADKNHVKIIRIIDGKPKSIRIKAGKILKGKENDYVLETGDIVVVPEAFW